MPTMIVKREDDKLTIECTIAEAGGLMLAYALATNQVEVREFGDGSPDDIEIEHGPTPGEGFILAVLPRVSE